MRLGTTHLPARQVRFEERSDVIAERLTGSQNGANLIPTCGIASPHLIRVAGDLIEVSTDSPEFGDGSLHAVQFSDRQWGQRLEVSTNEA
jgi:hypothetical protein